MTVNLRLAASRISSLNRHHHSVFSPDYHLVPVTRYRRKCINAEMPARLELIGSELTDKFEGQLLEFNGEADPIHLLVSLNPKVSPAGYVNSLKTVTSRLMRKEFRERLTGYDWKEAVFGSRSYCILSCGGAPLGVLRKYIEQQQSPV